ncbi:protein BREAKING OF ASYMMETRY IN THE STOMATAL LINEAGE-like [Lotus japonicus]|uniref:protein BREAKING OF ASYMMETRY IN THE STOMATAL LINEAGE-like n=1 Tax=Lotus japonicus TaxID=34305 RepID=UPI0025830E35|nr:protein BREAKING OF ASYMMETRY IN THE STOMATAL LINEAGE-like [Lotus japonicus]
MPRLTRLIVRDWSSCFLPHKLPLDDHGVASAPRVPVRNLAFDKRNQKRFNIIHTNTLSWPSKKSNNSNTQQNKSMVKEKQGVSVENRIDGSTWSLSLDEDYIVFCFEENQEFGAVKDERSVKSENLMRGLNVMHKNSKPLNSKVKYGEGAKVVSKHNILVKRPNDSKEHDQDCYREDMEKEMVHTSRQKKRDSTSSVCQVEGIEDCGGMVSAESRNSVQSEGSRGSFAFPVLGWEWIGSPVHMPRAEDVHLKNHKASYVGFQCCMF